MKTLTSVTFLFFMNLICFGQNIKTEDEVNLVKKIVDQQENLKDFVIAPTIFNNKGQTFPGKFSYRFIYDSSDISLVKIEVTDVEEKEIQSWYFRNEQLVMVISKSDKVYFLDSDFVIPYWGATPNKMSIKKDKYKETAYRLLITFNKYRQKNLTQNK